MNNQETYWRRNNHSAPEEDNSSDDEDYNDVNPSPRTATTKPKRAPPRRKKPPKRTANRNAGGGGGGAMASLSSLKGYENKSDKGLGGLGVVVGVIGSGMDAVGEAVVAGADVTFGATKTVTKKVTKTVAKGPIGATKTVAKGTIGATKTVVGGTIGATQKVVGGTIGAIGTVGGAVVGTVGGAIGLGGKKSSHSSLNTSASSATPPPPPSANSGPGWSLKASPGPGSSHKGMSDSASSFGNASYSSFDNIGEDELITTPLNDIIREEDEEDDEDPSSVGPGESQPSDEDKEPQKKTLVSKVNKVGKKAITGVGKTVNTVGTAVNGVGRQAVNLLTDSFHSGQSSNSFEFDILMDGEEDNGDDEFVPTFASRGRGRGRGESRDEEGGGSGGNMAMMMPNSPGMRTRSKSPGRSRSPGRRAARAASPGRRAASPGRRNFPPRRQLDSQRSERPGILQPNVAPSYKRFAHPPAPPPSEGMSPPRRTSPKTVGYNNSDGRARSVSLMIDQRDAVSGHGSMMRMDESELDVPRTTRLHKAAADPDSTIKDLREALAEDPSYASVADEDGKLPLHLISENDALTDNLGEDLDTFILDELIPKNRRALVAQCNEGHFPFVQALLDWVDLVNEIPQRRISEMSMSLELRKDEDAAEQLIPWNVVIDDVAFWGIRMLSTMIEREPLKANWVLKIVEVIASIPCFIKNILLVDDDLTRRALLETRLIHEVILHENSVGPWLVYMIISDDEVAQNRALLYMKLVTDIEEKLSQDSGSAMRSRVSAAFVTSNHQIQERKHKVYLKAASLPAVIPALMQFTKENFTEASSSSIVQFILDEALFQPETVLVILLDMFFLFAAVVMFTFCSNSLFSLVSEVKFAPVVSFYVNQTAADMCANGTLTDEASCMYFDKNGTFTDLGGVVMRPGSIDCDVDCQVCIDPSAFGDSVVQYIPTAFVDLGSSPTISCYDGNVDLVIDTLLIASIMFMSVNALYFTIRQLCTWLTVPHRFLRSQLGILREFFSFMSVAFPVVMLTIFLAMVYDLPTTPSGYMPPNFHAAWLENAEVYAACSAVAVGFLYLKILFYFKVLNQYTATFIFALGEVVKDIFWFFWIMVIILFAFSQMFFTTLSCEQGDCRNPNVTAEVFGVKKGSPFDNFYTTLLYSYAILLGQIDLFLFDTPFTTLLWVLYTFAVVIVVLNFLIAIVGDSYDKSMTKIEMHFGRARLMFMVEVSAFLSYIVAPLSGTEEDRGYRRLLLCGSVKGTILYFLFAGGLFTGFAFLTIEKNILDRSGDAIYISLATLLSVGVASPFLFKYGCVGCLRRFKIFKLLGKVLTAVFRVFLGKSIRGDRSDKEKKDWGGRIAHLIDSMNDVIRESEEITNSKISTIESMIHKSTSKLDQQMETVGKNTTTTVNEANRSMETRVAALEVNILEIKALVGNIHAMMEERREVEETTLSSGNSGESGNSSTSGGSGGVVRTSQLSRAKSVGSVYDG